MSKVLIVEDEANIRQLVKYNLEKESFQVIEAEDGLQGLRLAKAEKPDLVLLDLMLPQMDGLEVCRSLKGNQATAALPIIMLTAKSEEIDKVIGLELGADDYIVKPFEPRDLVARVRSILRRYQRAAIPEAVSERSSARFAGWVFDSSRHALTAPDGRELSLSAAEAGLLATLLRRPNKILSREQLLGERDVDPFDRSIDVRISRLRRKLDDDPQNPRLIKTVYGAGYLFSSQVEWV